MKRSLFTMILCLILGTVCMTAQSYKQLWDNIHLAEKNGQPRTAIENALKVFQKAQKEQHVNQMMQSYLTAMAHRKHLSIDSLYVDLEGMEKWVSAPTTSVSDAAMLHSLLGSIYTHSARGRYDNKVMSELPEDMSEWTQLMYYQRAFEHFMASVSQLEELRKYSTNDYSSITYKGRWSDYYNHDLMHLIGRRAAFGIRDLENKLRPSFKQTEWNTFTLDYEQFKNDTLTLVSAYDCPAQAMRIFQRMLALIDPKEQAGGWIFMEQNRMNLIPEYLRNTDEHLRLLNSMKERFDGNELCGSLCLDIATIYKRQEKYPEALSVLREGIKKYPAYGAVNLLKNMEQEILHPYFTMRSISSYYYPNDTVTLRVRHRNLNGFTVWMHRVNCPLDTLYKYQDNAEALKKYSKFHSEQKFKLVRDPKLLYTDTLIKMSLPTKAGVYLMEGLANGKRARLTSFFVSPYQLVLHSLPDGVTEYAVLDGKSGHPVPYATLHIAQSEWKNRKNQLNLIEKIQTDKNGCASSTVTNPLIRVSTATDNTMPYMTAGYYSRWIRRAEQKQLVTRLLSDRTHFRPGQTIYIKGISYWQLPDDSVRADEGEVLELALTNPKGQMIEKKTVKNNEFGSFSTEFVLPTNGLNGQYRIEVLGENTRTGDALYFHVEEYKLPTFEVTFDKVTTAYAIGDTVTVTGRALSYNGMPVANSKVNYEIHKSYYGWLRGWTDYRFNEDLQYGETLTDSDGCFFIKVYLDTEPEMEKLCWWKYHYEIQGNITSSVGESQRAYTQLILNSCPLNLNISFNGKSLSNQTHILKEDTYPLTFRVTNQGGAPINTQVHYQIYQANELKEHAEMDHRYKKFCRQIHCGTFESNQPLSLDFLCKLPSSCYKIVAQTALDGHKDSVQHTVYFTMYSKQETKVPIGAIDWFNWLENEVAIGQPARLQFGTQEKNVYVLMDVYSELKRIESRRFYMSDTVQTFTFDYLPQYGKGMNVSVMYVKDGHVNNFTQTLNKKLPEKKLELKWESFRNKLTSGTQEEWTVSVNLPDGTVADAELLASMHDASIDQLGRQQNWNFQINFPRLYSIYPRWRSCLYGGVSTNIIFDLLTKKVPTQYRYDDIVERYYDFNQWPLRKKEVLVGSMRGVAMQTSAKSGFVGSVSNDGMVLEEVALKNNADLGLGQGLEDHGQSSPESLPQGMKLRENFTETAFFQPHLRTDSTGRVKICFTLPDNLTRWHFRALAHTKQMEYGMLEDFATAQREFMIQPNLPRFVRVGDETTIRATISNLSGKTVKGTVRLELIDPLTEKVILTRKAKFKTEAGKTITVSFAFVVKNTDVSLPICRIVADGGKFSDGEQRYLPVLTNKVWVTESLPLIVNGPGTVKESLSHLFNRHSRTASNHRLTVEMTGNPIWTAIQALPSVATPTAENAFSWASAWYAHNIASHIAQSNPKIKTVFDNWQTDENNKEALWSNLQKNEELKNILLTEIPWVTDATDESAQKRQLALLFNKAHTDSQISLYLDKLETLQNPDGGWSWYKGMHSSRYVTTYILELMERVIYLTGNELDYPSRQIMALATEYLNRELLEEYQQMQKREKEGAEVYPSELAIHYLSSLALNRKQLDKNVQKAVEYMVKHLSEQFNNLTPYGKAKACIILKQHGKQDEIVRFLTSLKEYTTYTPQLGRYFDTPQPYYTWRDNRLPTHVAVIEAFSFAGDNDFCIEQMKQWLLMQKQTQCWDNPLNTVDAIHALLMPVNKEQTDNLQVINLSVKQSSSLKIDGRPISSATSPLLGLDYQKCTYTTDELKRLPQEATLEKFTTGLAWGAVYAQYLEDMDNVSSTYTGRTATAYGKELDQPLSIERTLFVEKNPDNGNELSSTRQIVNSSTTNLQVGDKVISRLTIRADRAMDFVQIKDSRAACLEPVSSASGYRWENGLGYYCSVKDAATLYFIDHLPKGTYTIEQVFRIDRSGRYQAGIATIQCAYAPEFAGHTECSEMKVE